MLLAAVTAPIASADNGPAPVPQTRNSVALAGADLVTAVADGDVLALRSRPDGGALADPDSSLFTVAGTDAVHASFAATDLGLSAGTTGTVQYAVESITAPDGASVEVTDPDDDSHVLLSSSPDGPSTVEVPVGERVAGAWRFSKTGRYTLTLLTTATVTSDSDQRTLYSQDTTYAFDVGNTGPVSTTTSLKAKASRVDPDTPATLTATVSPSDASGAVEFYEDTTLLGHATVRNGAASLTTSPLAAGEHSFTATFVPRWSSDAGGSSSDPAVVRSAPPTVLSVGSIALTPKISGVSADGNEFDTFALGLLDRTGTYADQKWYPAQDAVLQVPDREHDDATGLWSTPTSVADVPGYTTGDGARLLMGQDTAAAVGGINQPVTNAINALPQGPATLVAATMPSGGRFRAYRPSSQAPIWDSSTLDTPGSQGTITAPKASKSIYAGWTFDAPGTYCLTISQTLATGGLKTPVTRQATYTVVVGPLPDHLTTCAQVPAADTPPDGDDPNKIHVLKTGHLDVRGWLNDAKNGMDFGVKYGDDYLKSRDIVLAGTNEGTIPTPTDLADLTFIGPAGSSYWYWSQSVHDPNTELWPGFSSENWSPTDIAPFEGISTTLEGVSGPAGGDVVLFNDTASAGGGLGSPRGVYFDSAWGMPMTWTHQVPGHTHMGWAFTRPGRYCLNMSTRTQMADGTWLSGGGQLTVWAGDPAQADSVTPCDRTTDTPALATLPRVDETVASGPQVSTQGRDTIEPYLDGDRLKVTVKTRVHTIDAALDRDIDDVVFSTRRKVGSYYQLSVSDDTPASPGLDVSTDRLGRGAISGTVTTKLGAVQGPGRVYTSSAPGKPTMLDSAGTSSQHSYTQGAATERALAFRVDSAGVYCIPMTWTATPAGASAPVTVAKTITLVAGSTDPADPEYVDRSKLTTCARGQQPTAPGGGTGPVAEPWNVANGSLTDAGQTILNDGHIDLASRIEDGALTTTVKDTTESNVPTYRQLPQTVLQLLPGAETTVPSSPLFAFLGKPGSAIWQVSQTQQDDLLWPGWSTEEIPEAATTGGVTWTLTGVRGANGTAAPGAFALYTTDSFGTPTVLFNSRDGVTGADRFEIPKITHAHGSWAFSKEGTYCLAFTRTATAAGGDPLRTESVLAVSVGTNDVTKVDPAACGSFESDRLSRPDRRRQRRRGRWRFDARSRPDSDPGAAAQPWPGRRPGAGAAGPPGRGPTTVKPVVLSAKAITARARVQTVSTERLVTVATLACPKGGGSCKLTVPKRVKVTIAGKRYTATVLAARTLKAGKRATLRVRLSKAAVSRLKGRTAMVRIKVTVSANGRKVARTVKVTIKGAPKHKATTKTTTRR